MAHDMSGTLISLSPELKLSQLAQSNLRFKMRIQNMLEFLAKNQSSEEFRRRSPLENILALKKQFLCHLQEDFLRHLQEDFLRHLQLIGHTTFQIKFNHCSQPLTLNPSLEDIQFSTNLTANLSPKKTKILKSKDLTRHAWVSARKWL